MAYPNRQVIFVPPTGTDLLNLVSSNAIANSKAGTTPAIQLPDRRTLARMVVRQENFLSLVDWF